MALGPRHGVQYVGVTPKQTNLLQDQCAWIGRVLCVDGTARSNLGLADLNSFLLFCCWTALGTSRDGIGWIDITTYYRDKRIRDPCLEHLGTCEKVAMYHEYMFIQTKVACHVGKRQTDFEVTRWIHG